MSELSPRAPRKATEKIDDGMTLIEIGQWYWVKGRRGDKEWDPNAKRKAKDEYEWFACVVEVGTNYVKVESPGGTYVRIHQDHFFKQTRRELNHREYIRKNVTQCTLLVQKKLAEVRALTARLGVSTRHGIDQVNESAGSGLITMSQAPDIKSHKRALVRAKDKQLPKLFKEIEEAHEELAIWMKAEAVPMKAMAEDMKGCIGQVEDRIFSVSLYAGLTEDVERIADGEPADISEKLHLMQKRLYMDEECLLSYKTGGIDIRSIKDFDAWLAEPEHRDRILPFPRCMVAFRIRRNEKNRKWDGTIASFFINMDLAEQDRLTFLYIRNGDKIYRMDCDLEFGELIFPSKGEFDPSGPMMFGHRWGEYHMIPVREYDQLIKDRDEELEKHKQWVKDHKKQASILSPHYHGAYEHPENDWEEFNNDSVYYDDAVESLRQRIQQYNRIVLIIQGLCDRSPVLHPHPPVKTWTAEGFEAAIKLVYDGTNTIYHGDPPDFDEYRKKCNQTLGPGSITIGQEDFWERREAEKEMTRNWRQNSLTHHRPYGNPGPGELASIAQFTRSRKARFRWVRKRQGWGSIYSRGKPGDPMPASIQVPEEKLFNISAYKPGDFLLFFQDPRTREKYLQWTELLLTAEEYHAGNITLDSDMSGSLARNIKDAKAKEERNARRKASRKKNKKKPKSKGKKRGKGEKEKA